MPLSDATIQQLQDALDAVQEWEDQKVAEVESQAEFLRSVNVAVSSVSEEASDEATDSALDLVNSILAS